jgi:hypothetical protein
MEVATKPAGRRGTGRRSRSQSVAAQDCDGFQRLDAHLKSELLVRSSYKEIAACSVACKELNSLAVANHVWTPHLAKKYGLQLKVCAVRKTGISWLVIPRHFMPSYLRAYMSCRVLISQVQLLVSSSCCMPVGLAKAPHRMDVRYGH